MRLLNSLLMKKSLRKQDPHISESEFRDLGAGFPLYENSLIVELFENDSLIISSFEEERKMVFRSFFYRLDGKIKIDGAFGMFGGFGFSIGFMDDGEPIVTHLLASDDWPEYSLTKDGDLEYRLEVPCTDVKLVLSKMPLGETDEVIYGMVEFKSLDYYPKAPSENGLEIVERKRTRTNMKIYFKTRFMDIDKF